MVRLYLSLFYLLRCGIFFHSLGVQKLISKFLSLFAEEIVPYGAVVLVCLWEKMGSGSSYVAILNHSVSTLRIRA